MCQASYSLQEPSEGAIGAGKCLLEGEEFFVVDGRVWHPLGMDGEVLLHPLMAEEELLVTPVRCSQLGLGHDLSNLLFSAAKLHRDVNREHVVQDSTHFNRCELIPEVASLARLHRVGETVFAAGDKTKFPGEHRRSLLSAILRVLGHIG